MNEHLQKELANLASKLGTTSEHLWGVLVRQAYIDGLSSLFVVTVCLILTVITIVSFVFMHRKHRGILDKDLGLSMWPPPEYARWFCLAPCCSFCCW
jgi:hypothetical protein